MTIRKKFLNKNKTVMKIFNKNTLILGSLFSLLTIVSYAVSKNETGNHNSKEIELIFYDDYEMSERDRRAAMRARKQFENKPKANWFGKWFGEKEDKAGSDANKTANTENDTKTQQSSSKEDLTAGNKSNEQNTASLETPNSEPTTSTPAKKGGWFSRIGKNAKGLFKRDRNNQKETVATNEDNDTSSDTDSTKQHNNSSADETENNNSNDSRTVAKSPKDRRTQNDELQTTNLSSKSDDDPIDYVTKSNENTSENKNTDTSPESNNENTSNVATKTNTEQDKENNNNTEVASNNNNTVSTSPKKTSNRLSRFFRRWSGNPDGDSKQTSTNTDQAVASNNQQPTTNNTATENNNASDKSANATDNTDATVIAVSNTPNNEEAKTNKNSKQYRRWEHSKHGSKRTEPNDTNKENNDVFIVDNTNPSDQKNSNKTNTENQDTVVATTSPDSTDKKGIRIGNPFKGIGKIFSKKDRDSNKSSNDNQNNQQSDNTNIVISSNQSSTDQADGQPQTTSEQTSERKGFRIGNPFKGIGKAFSKKDRNSDKSTNQQSDNTNEVISSNQSSTDQTNGQSQTTSEKEGFRIGNPFKGIGKAFSKKDRNTNNTSDSNTTTQDNSIDTTIASNKSTTTNDEQQNRWRFGNIFSRMDKRVSSDKQKGWRPWGFDWKFRKRSQQQQKQIEQADNVMASITQEQKKEVAKKEFYKPSASGKYSIGSVVFNESYADAFHKKQKYTLNGFSTGLLLPLLNGDFLKTENSRVRVNILAKTEENKGVDLKIGKQSSVYLDNIYNIDYAILRTGRIRARANEGANFFVSTRDTRVHINEGDDIVVDMTGDMVTKITVLAGSVEVYDQTESNDLTLDNGKTLVVGLNNTSEEENQALVDVLNNKFKFKDFDNIAERHLIAREFSKSNIAWPYVAIEKVGNSCKKCHYVFKNNDLERKWCPHCYQKIPEEIEQ